MASRLLVPLLLVLGLAIPLAPRRARADEGSVALLGEEAPPEDGGGPFAGLGRALMKGVEEAIPAVGTPRRLGRYVNGTWTDEDLEHYKTDQQRLKAVVDPVEGALERFIFSHPQEQVRNPKYGKDEFLSFGLDDPEPEYVLQDRLSSPEDYFMQDLRKAAIPLWVELQDLRPQIQKGMEWEYRARANPDTPVAGLIREDAPNAGLAKLGARLLFGDKPLRKVVDQQRSEQIEDTRKRWGEVAKGVGPDLWNAGKDYVARKGVQIGANKVKSAFGQGLDSLKNFGGSLFGAAGSPATGGGTAPQGSAGPASAPSGQSPVMEGSVAPATGAMASPVAEGGLLGVGEGQ